MGRPGLTHHRKFARLARLVGSEAVARGSLELLWDVAYENGDDLMGDALDVEFLAKWQGEPGKLAEALADAGFLDKDGSAFRVHDLWDHAPDYVVGRRDREQERRKDKKCVACGTIFHSPDYRAKHCSAACRTAAYRSRVTDGDAQVRHSDTTLAPAPAPAPAPQTLEALSSPSGPREPTIDPATGVLEDEDLARAGAHAHVAEPMPDFVQAVITSGVPAVATCTQAEAKAFVDAIQAELPGTPPPPGAEDMQRIWNDLAPAKCSRWMKNTNGRKKAAEARLEEHKGEAGGALAWWERLVRRVAASSFLRGDRTTWCADIDFVLKPGSIVKIEEGKYDDRAGDVRTGSVRAEDMQHSEKVGVVSVEEWTNGGDK